MKCNIIWLKNGFCVISIQQRLRPCLNFEIFEFFFVSQIFVLFLHQSACFANREIILKISKIFKFRKLAFFFIYPRIGGFGNFQGYFATFWNLHLCQGRIFFVFLGKIMLMANFENLQICQTKIFFRFFKQISKLSHVRGHLSNFRNFQPFPSFSLREIFLLWLR